MEVSYLRWDELLVGAELELTTPLCLVGFEIVG